MAALHNEKYENMAVHHDENAKSEGDTTPPQHELISYEPQEEKKLIRKIDGRLLPILGALYSIALIDRVNVSIVPVLFRASQTQTLKLTDLRCSHLRHGRRPAALHWRSVYHRSSRVFPALQVSLVSG